MSESVKQQIQDSDMIFNAISLGAYDNFNQARDAVVSIFVPDTTVSRSGISHALNRLEKHYNTESILKAKDIAIESYEGKIAAREEALKNAIANIAELKADLLSCSNEDIALRDAIADLVKALEEASAEFKKLPHALGYDITHCKRYDSLVAKHKGQS